MTSCMLHVHLTMYVLPALLLNHHKNSSTLALLRCSSISSSMLGRWLPSRYKLENPASLVRPQRALCVRRLSKAETIREGYSVTNLMTQTPTRGKEPELSALASTIRYIPSPICPTLRPCNAWQPCRAWPMVLGDNGQPAGARAGFTFYLLTSL